MIKVALVDVDDTLADTQTLILKHVNQGANRRYRFTDVTREFREGKVEEYERFVRSFLSQPELVSSVAVYPDVADGLKQLKDQGYAVHIASSRQENLHATTQNWLERHDLIKYVDAVHGRHSSQGGCEFKVETAAKIGAEIAFDDTLDVARALATNGVLMYLIDKPWNQGDDKLPHNLMRVPSFNQAVRLNGGASGLS